MSYNIYLDEKTQCNLMGIVFCGAGISVHDKAMYFRLVTTTMKCLRSGRWLCAHIEDHNFLQEELLDPQHGAITSYMSRVIGE